jgi:hypothetical protein
VDAAPSPPSQVNFRPGEFIFTGADVAEQSQEGGTIAVDTNPWTDASIAVHGVNSPAVDAVIEVDHEQHQESVAPAPVDDRLARIFLRDHRSTAQIQNGMEIELLPIRDAF